MQKDAYYFPHFSNARHDRKLRRIQKELGIEGYGIYFMLLEVLREMTRFSYPMEDIDLLADEFGTSEQKVRTVIANYELFEIDGDYFFSPNLLKFLEPYFDKKNKARLAANKRWELDKPANGEKRHDIPQVYIIHCFKDGEEFIKVGATSTYVARRYSRSKMPYEYTIIRQIFTQDLYKIEEELTSDLDKYQYTPTIRFDGDKECYAIEAIHDIVDYTPPQAVYDYYHNGADALQLRCNASKVNKSKVNKSKVNKSKKGSSESVSLPSSLTTKKDCDTWKHHISKPGVDELPPGFAEMWEAYPKKTDKKGAVKKYLETRKVCGFDDLMRAVRNYAVEVKDREKQYIKHAKTFFGPDEPWRDYLENDLTDHSNNVTMVKTIDMEAKG